MSMTTEVSSQDFALTLPASALTLPAPAMEYTKDLSLEELKQLVADKKVIVRPIAVFTGEVVEIVDSDETLPADHKLVAPTTLAGEKIVFELSWDTSHSISDQYDHVIGAPHETSNAQSVAMHINLNDEASDVLNALDEYVKKMYRGAQVCKSWIPLVKTTFSGEKVLTVDIVLDNSEAATQLLIMQEDMTMLEGSGSDFLTTAIGGVENLKDYTCNPTLELAWVMFRVNENAHRLRVKVHAIILKKKVKKAAMRVRKMSSAKIEAFTKSNALIRLTSSF